MPSRATDITVEEGEQKPPSALPASRRPSVVIQMEDSRILPDSHNAEGEALPVEASAAARGDGSTGDAPLPLRTTARPLWHGSPQWRHVRVQTPEMASSPTESVASPPFLPTSRHHDFFMDDLESHGESEGSPTASTHPGWAAASHSPTATFHTVIARSRRSSAADTVAGVPAAAPGSTAAAAAAASSDTAANAEEGGTAEQPVALQVVDGGRKHRKHRRRTVATAPPFDPKRAQQLNLLTLGPDPELPLYTFEEIPHWQKYNPYIRSGYRAFYNATMCLKSLLGWHNETINVYSHFLSFIAFVVLTVLLYTTVLSKAISAPSMSASKVMYAIFCFGSMICMLNSSIYHLFNCHSHQRVMTAMGRLDFIGITILIVASFLPPLYVMFHCYTKLRIVYISAILILGTMGIVGPWTNVFHEHVGLRVATFLGMGFSGVVPAVHSCFLLPTTSATFSTVTGVWLMVLLYCGGVVFYVTQFPESVYPGHFDHWLSSHQIWHFFVSMAAIVHYFNCVSMYQMWQIKMTSRKGTRSGAAGDTIRRRNNDNPPPVSASEEDNLSPRKVPDAAGKEGAVNSAKPQQQQQPLAENPCSCHSQKLPQPHNDNSALPLYRLEDVPKYLGDNIYILRYYRAYYSTKQCFHSLFHMHNETINIWSHLIGVVVFVGLVARLFVRHIVPEYQAGNVFHQPNRTAFPTAVEGARTTWPFLIFGAYSFGCVMCMLCSASFHTFLCHMSEDLYHRAHALDYFGITFLIVGSFLPFCYYAMGCAPAWRNAYISMICTFGVIGLVGPFFRHWTSVHFSSKRTVFYVCMVASGLIPTIHLAFMIPLAISFPYVFGLLVMLALYGIGVFIYAFRIPEVFAPGKYDVYFSSHQIWHVCVMAAAITHFYNCTQMYLNRGTIVCT